MCVSVEICGPLWLVWQSSYYLHLSLVNVHFLFRILLPIDVAFPRMYSITFPASWNNKKLIFSWLLVIYTSPAGGLWGIVMHVSVLSVCLSVYSRISETIWLNFTKLFVHVDHGRGSCLLWQCCNTLCTSSFVDEVIFLYNGPYGVPYIRK